MPVNLKRDLTVMGLVFALTLIGDVLVRPIVGYDPQTVDLVIFIEIVLFVIYLVVSFRYRVKSVVPDPDTTDGDASERGEG